MPCNQKLSAKVTLGRCSEWPRSYCSGKMTVYRHRVRCAVWKHMKCNCAVRGEVPVLAHCFPVWVQCSGCGYAPTGEKLSKLFKKLLRLATDTR